MTFLVGILAAAHVVGAGAVVGEVFVVVAQARVLVILVGVAEHGLEVVATEATMQETSPPPSRHSDCSP